MALHPDLNITTADRRNCVGGETEEDNTGHGTNVAGIIAAKDDGQGTVGIAPGARLRSVKMVNAIGDSLDTWAICAIDDASFTRVDGIVGNDVWVANASWGLFNFAYATEDGNCGRTRGDPLHVAVCRARDRGLTIVTAAGNHGRAYGTAWLNPECDCRATPRPAVFNEVLTVTAMADYNGRGGGGASATCAAGNDSPDDRYDNVSNWAIADDQAHTIAAPGDCIFTTSNQPAGYEAFSGTSAAAPHATGVVALCIWGLNNTWGACNGRTPAQIIAQIRADAQTYSTNNPGYRFAGDPFNPLGGYFGYLVEADTY